MTAKNYTALQSVVIGGESYRLGDTVTLNPESRQAKQLIKGNIIGEHGIINSARPLVAPGASPSSSLVGQASPETTASESGNGETTTTPEQSEAEQAPEQTETPEATESPAQPEQETQKRGRKKQG